MAVRITSLENLSDSGADAARSSAGLDAARWENDRLRALVRRAEATLSELRSEERRLLARVASAEGALAASEDELTRMRTGRDEALRAAALAQDFARRTLSESARLNELLSAAERKAAAAIARIPPFDWQDLLQKAKEFSAAGVPLFVTDEGKLALGNAPTQRRQRVALVSVPRAGTYMHGEFFKAFGFVDAGIHAAEWGFADFRWRRKEEILGNLPERNVAVSPDHYLETVRPGEYILSHLPCSEEIRGLLSSFRIVFAVRELRSCFVSYMRYVAAHSLLSAQTDGWVAIAAPRERMARFAEVDGEDFFKLVRPLVGWQEEARALTVRYEDLMGDNGAARADVALTALGRHLLDDPEAAGGVDRAAVLNQETLTSSGSRSVWADYWSDPVETIFDRAGGNELNARFGY